jgi:ribosomal protein L37E
MQVICPTGQELFCAACGFFRQRVLVKSLNGWRCFFRGQYLRRFHGGRRACLSGHLLLGSGPLGYGCGLCGTSIVRPRSLPGMRSVPGARCVPRARGGPPKPPGTRDRRSCGISNECTGHRADRPENHRARHRAQGSASGALLGLSLERKKRRCDRCGNQQFFHRDFPGPSAGTEAQNYGADMGRM